VAEKFEPAVVDRFDELVLIPPRISARSAPITVEKDDTELSTPLRTRVEKTDPQIVDIFEAVVDRYTLLSPNSISVETERLEIAVERAYFMEESLEPIVVDRVERPAVRKRPRLLTPSCSVMESSPWAVDILLMVVIVLTERLDRSRLYPVLSDETADWIRFDVFENEAAFESS